MKTELWSIKERMAYNKDNAKLISIGGVMVLATPKNEILVTRVI